MWRYYEPILAKTDPTLVDQLEFGFDMGIQNEESINIPVTNHRSARDEFQVIDEFIIKHHKDGSLLGPYLFNPLPVHVKPSPMQVAKSSSGKKRPVLDMSYPKGSSVNDSISSNWNDIGEFKGEFRLPTHDQICKAALTTPDPVMFITDMKAYYMQLPSEWKSAPLMALTWRGAIFFHRRLPFGCRSSCLHAQRVTDGVVAIYSTETGNHLSGYVDDFCSIIRQIISALAYEYFQALADKLGLLRTLEKCMIPDKIRIFLGLLYNLADMTMSLPDEKVLRAIGLLTDWLNKDQCSKQQAQSLLGHVNHISAVIHAGRPFTARIVDLLRSAQFPAEVSQDLKSDIGVWINFLQSDFQKKCIIKSQELAVADQVLKVAVKGQTCVIICDGNIDAFKLHVSVPKVPNHAMYAIAVWQASCKYKDMFKDSIIKISVPTKAAAMVINRARTPCTIIRPLIRQMWMVQAYNDFLVKAVTQSNQNDSVYDFFLDFKDIKLPK